MKPILKFNQKSLKAVRFFTKNLNYPIAMASYNEWQEQQISYLCSNYERLKLNSEELCLWCIRHEIQYQIMYPLKRFPMIRNPYKYYKYLKLKKRLNYT